MKLDFELSELALKDLNSIWIYTANEWSVDQANSYYEQIFGVIDQICFNPEIGKSIKEVKENHRTKIVRSHIIVYKVEREILFIDRILHQRMDIENQLLD